MAELNLLFKHEMIALDPNGFNSDSSSATVVLKMVCQGLLKFDHNGVLAPDLALRWTASPDWTHFRFELDPAARFHSGRPCDADAVAACFRRLLHPASSSILAQDYRDLERIDVLSPTEITFTFSRPTTSFLHNLAWRTHIVDDTQRQPIGTGPFELTQWQRGKGLVLERATQDRTLQPGNVSTARITFAPRGEERLAIVRAGGADIVESLPGIAAQPLADAGLIRLGSTPAQQKATICFNCRRGPFDDRRLRLAVAHAVDRQPLAARFGGPDSAIVDGLLPDQGLAADMEPLLHDPDKARYLLHKAGYHHGIKIRAAATNVAPVPDLVAQVASDLAQVGIVLEATFYDDPPWWPYMYLLGPWDIAFQASPARPHPDTLLMRELRTGGAFNAGGYSAPRLDGLIDEARGCVDQIRQRAIYADIQRLVREDMPVFVLFGSNVTVGWRGDVTGFAPHPMGVIDISGVNLPLTRS